MNLPATATDVWTPATDEDKLKAIAALSSLPSRLPQSLDLAEASYFVALDGVTKYGLAEAVKAILQNALGHAFFPSPPELRGQCDKAMEPHRQAREEAYRREKSLYREVPRRTGPVTDEERERAKALMARLNASFEKDKQSAQEAERAEVRARYGMTPDILAQLPDAPVTPLSKPAAE